jgi:VWFA-related protein
MSIDTGGKFQWVRLPIGLLCLLMLVFCPLFPGLPDGHAAAAQSYSLRVDVELVTTEVIVLDKRGNPVRNLKKEDFRLYEDGKQQEILSFDEVSEEHSPISLVDFDDGETERGKTVLIFFDDSTVTSSHIQSTRDSAARFVKEHMRPHDLIAVAAFGNSLKVLQSFTRDQEKVLEAISQPAMSSSETMNRLNSPIEQMKGNQQRPGEDSAYNSSVATFLRYRSENLLRALNILTGSIQRLKGQKSILIYSESGYFSEILQSTYKNTLDSAKKANVVFYTVDPSGLTSGIIGKTRKPSIDRGNAPSVKTAYSGFALRGLSPILGGIGSMNRSFFSNSLFQQSGGGQSGGGSSGSGGSGGSSGSGNSGGSTGGSTGAGPSRGNTGGSTANPGTSTTYPSSNSPRTNSPWGNDTMGNRMPDTFRMDQSNQNLLRSLADETGGWAIYNTNDFDSELDKLDRQLSNYYILGFQSNNPKRDGSFRKLEVKTDLKDVKLRYRKGYLDRRPLDTLADSKEEESLLDAMAAPEPATQLPLSFRVSYFYDSPRLARVIVSAKIGMGKLKLKKKGKELRGELNAMGVAYAEDGSTSARFSETLNLSLDRDSETDFRKRSLTYRNHFMLRPGKYRLKLAVSDTGDNLGSMVQPLELPVFPESELVGSSLVIAEQISALPDLIQNLQTKLLDDSDPLIYSGMQISPSVENRLPVDSPLPIFFKLYNLTGGSGPLKLSGRAKLVSETGEEKLLPWIPLDKNASRIGNSEAAIGFSLVFENTIPGKYRLVIEAAETDTSTPAMVQTDVEIVKN